ncbi:MAG: LuxR C-terminal-related transcriptional regulator [Nitriliruptorales bacterium]|nr:LuxR C-terminal-related transcriptional regulator [Nitriliruptorales bacterium]
MAILHPEMFVREGLAALLTGAGEELVGATDDDNGLNLTEAPDVLLTAVDPERYEKAAIRFVEQHPETPVLALGSATGNGVNRVLSSGAAGVVPATAAGEEVLAAVRAVARGWLVLPGAGYRDTIKRLAAVRSALAELDDEQADLLGGLAEGHTIAELAERLFVSERTVKRRIAELRGKLGCETREELVALYGAAMLDAEEQPA